MAYTKGQMVDQIYLLISGGQPTEDFNVQRADISIYIANAINHVALVDSRRRRREAKMLNKGSTGVDTSFLSTEYLDIQTDTKQDLKFVTFDKKPLLLDDAYGISEVSAVQGEVPFVKMSSKYDGSTLDYLYTGVTRWYYEKTEGEERIYLKNISHVIEQIRVAYVPSFDDLDDDDVVPLPSGMEIEVVNMAVQFFTVQADRPADDLNNHNDDRNAKLR
jgi:hypothetical protein